MPGLYHPYPSITYLEFSEGHKMGNHVCSGNKLKIAPFCDNFAWPICAVLHSLVVEVDLEMVWVGRDFAPDFFNNFHHPEKSAWVKVMRFFQFLEYQTDVRRYRFDNLGKLAPALQYKVLPGAGGWTCCCGNHTIIGFAHRSRAVGAPARWAGVNFPTGVNLAYWFRPNITDTSALAA